MTDSPSPDESGQEPTGEELDETLATPRRLDGRLGRSLPESTDEPLATLVVLAHPDPSYLGRRFPLRPSTTRIVGRASEVDLPFPSIQGMSRRHARFVSREDHVVVEDLESKNGTLVNGRSIRTPTRLHHDDRVEIETLTLKLLQGDDVESAYHETIYDLVMRDELTGIYNRRMLEHGMDRDLARARRHDRPLAIVIFDIDDFKVVNDTFGHPAGDAVLIRLANLVEPRLRRDSVFARIGGDEFLVLCPEVGIDGATVLAERIRSSIEDHEFDFEGRGIRITCSFGIAELGKDMTSSGDLYSAADAALYRSKTGGGNRVTSPEDPQSTR